MLRSMTAYGRSSQNNAAGHFIVEIQSVNRKFLEVTVSLPRELNQFEIEIKKLLQPHITRGQVTVKVSVTFEGIIPFIIRPNLPLARQLKSAWDEIIKDLNLKPNDSFLTFLENAEGILSYEENRAEEETYRVFLQNALQVALEGFLSMKNQEGSVLQADISQRLENIGQIIKTIELKIPGAANRYREKLIARLDELLPGHVENEERILREVALFADKIDIAEEITRFHCHLTHFKELITSDTQAVGKTLEFVLQELNREVNTIGNKSLDLEIARGVIDIKSELERIREQIHNIE